MNHQLAAVTLERHWIVSELNEDFNIFAYPSLNFIISPRDALHMATVDSDLNRGEQYRFIITSAGTQYATVAAGLILGLPVVAYFSGNLTIMFYVHIGLAAFWFGTDFFFRYVLAPAVEESGPETAMALIPHLSSKLMIVGESLTLGTISSGIGLADRLGYLATPTIWVWGALGIALVMIFVAFVPLHHYQTQMLIEIDSPEPDGKRVKRLNATALRWLMGMTGLFLGILVMMIGMRGLI